ncbi:MAG: alpha/beta fold hydrolase [Burkholderiaceae bacterium]|nr:alpha/beta fold hydrolase [Burkholderiaceae bacterium]
MIETREQALPHGVTLSLRTAGERGRPVLLFLHGFPEAAFIWDDMLAHFSQPAHGGYRCVAPNLRGFEKSSAPADVSAYRPRQLAADIEALIDLESPGRPLACLVAHDWGGAVAWYLANQKPQRMDRLAIVNSPHPGTFARDMKSDPAQQAASAYMNFLVRPDAEALLVADDYRRLWAFLSHSIGGPAHPAWLTEALKDRYRAVWAAGLTGGCNYYRASPLRPPRPEDPAAAAVDLPRSMLTIDLPTLVIWGMRDLSLPPHLLVGLEDYVPQLQLHTIEDATHWVIHEQPQRVAALLSDFLHA